MAKVDGGHAVVAFSIIFFIIASYAVFFSAFLPETGISVCLITQLKIVQIPEPLCRTGIEHAGRGHALQVLHHPHYPHHLLLCHSQLGRLAILQQLLTHFKLWTLVLIYSLQACGP